MYQAKTPAARPMQGRTPHAAAPAAKRHIVDGLEALDRLQLWSTRRVRIAYLTQARPLAA